MIGAGANVDAINMMGKKAIDLVPENFKEMIHLLENPEQVLELKKVTFN